MNVPLRGHPSGRLYQRELEQTFDRDLRPPGRIWAGNASNVDLRRAGVIRVRIHRISRVCPGFHDRRRRRLAATSVRTTSKLNRPFDRWRVPGCVADDERTRVAELVVDWDNDFRNAHVDRTKIVDYLLDAATPRGAAKSRFFRSIGFVPSRWDELAAALRSQARGARLREVSTPWGLKVIAVGPLDAPNGRRYKITTVWIVEASRTRLVTAYPKPGSKP